MKSSPSIADFRPELLHPRLWTSWLALPPLFVLAWTPQRFRHGLGNRIGKLIAQRNTKRRNIVLTNLQLCFPELETAQRIQLAQQTFENYACALLDYSVLFFRSRRWLHQQTVINGHEHIDNALSDRKNIVLLLGHSVWLEFAPLAIGQHYPTYGSYKPFRNPVLNWMIARSRLKDVSEVIAREEGMIKLIRSLKPGKLLFFLPDEDHGPKHSVFAPFFSVPKATLTTPARIAKMSKAQCLPVMTFFNRETGKYQIEIGEALPEFGQQTDVDDATAMNQGFERLISEHKNQYMWQLKLFRTTRPGDTQPY